MKPTIDQITKVLYDTMPLVRREQVITAANEIQKLFKRNEFQSMNTMEHPFNFHVHPFTCDCSGGDSCERLNKVSEGEMKCIDGNFICPCEKYIQHKCSNHEPI